ncbi:MAG TPA: hypothetical protein PK657_06145 [Legionella sp.]|nr:hypothetical protein [Legionella sp.]
MPRFTEFLNNAKNLNGSLTARFLKPQGCISFFSSFVASSTYILDDAEIISKIAATFDEDDLLIDYILVDQENYDLDATQLEFFKIKTLSGFYILKWAEYSESLTSFVYKPLIEFFQKELQLNSLGDMDDEFYNSSLFVFSQYCSFLYKKSLSNELNTKVYFELINRLGSGIQVDIHNKMRRLDTHPRSWSDTISGIAQRFGMDSLF